MTTDYLVLCFKGAVQFDALPVMKVTHYPYERGSYKPFAQGFLCMADDRLVARLWAFEAKPEAASELAMALKGPTGRRLSLSFKLSGESRVCLDGGAAEFDAKIRPIAGEDLQGEYWGADITLSAELTRALGLAGPCEGARLYGNIYKLCNGERPHFGSFFPVDGKDATACPAAFALTHF